MAFFLVGMRVSRKGEFKFQMIKSSFDFIALASFRYSKKRAFKTFLLIQV